MSDMANVKNLCVCKGNYFISLKVKETEMIDNLELVDLVC